MLFLHLSARPVRPFSALLLPVLAACGSSASSLTSRDAGHVPDVVTIVLPDAGRDTGHVKASTDAADGSADADHGAISTTYPAFTPDLPQVVNNNGGVLANPVIVTISWPVADPSSTIWEGMGDGIGPSTYWKAATFAYGVGAATSGDANHVRMGQALPASIGYSDLDTFVQTAVAASQGDAGVVTVDAGADAGTSDAATNPRWPAPTLVGGISQTIYSLIIPASTSVTDPGSGASFCDEGALGYHTNVMVGSTAVAYSVSLACAGQTVPDVEETMAHEYVEAATNPFPNTSALGYVGFDQDHLAWDLYTGFNDELADACQSFQDSYFEEPAPFAYWVQAVWSNANATAGHNPCAPAATTAPYSGLTLFPSEEKMVTVNLASVGLSTEMTRGFEAKVGQTVTFQVGFYSDAKTTGPIAISYDFPTELQLFTESGNPLTNGAATVTIDVTSGENGQTANVSVTPTKAGPLGFQLMALTWDAPMGLGSGMYAPHYLPLIISNQ